MSAPEPSIIDMWAPVVPTPELLRHAVDNFPDEMLGYLRVFYKQPPTQEAFRARASAIQLSTEEVIAALDAAGIAQTLITGFDERASVGKTFVPNELVAPLHDRMPAVIPPEEFTEWLDADTSPQRLRQMLRPYPASRMTAHPVSRRVSDVRNDDPGCIEPLAAEEPKLL